MKDLGQASTHRYLHIDIYVTRSGHGLIHNLEIDYERRNNLCSSHVVKATVTTMRLFTAQ
jgi:hypothetical protein